MYHCMEQFGNPAYRIGNIKNKMLNYSSLAQGMFAQDPFDDEECRNCKVLPICGGGCPLDRIKKQDKKKGSLCSLYKNHIEELMPFMYKHITKK